MKQKSLRYRLLLYFTLIAIIPAFVTTSITFFHNQKDIQNSVINDNQQMLSQVMERISHKISQVDDFSNWICQNPGIQDLLILPSENVNSYTLAKAQTIRELRLQSSYRPISEYILSLFIVGNNGADIRDGPEASMVDINILHRSVDRFSVGYWSGIMENLTPLSDNQSVLMYCHPILDPLSHTIAGHVAILFSENLFLDEFKYFTQSPGKYALLKTDHGQILSLAGPKSQEQVIDILSDLMKQEASPDYFTLNVINSVNRLTIQGLVSTEPMRQQITTTTMSMILLVCISLAITLLLAYFLSIHFNRPIVQMTANVRYISNGQFLKVSAIEDQSELGELNRHIIQMSQDIVQLMEDQKKREKEKRYLEMRILQAQINPHFLYNTLNSIKLMASMQGAYNICSMVEKLGQMLRVNQQIREEWIMLEEELALLESYIYIQNIRFKGKIRYQAQMIDHNLGKLKILKFTLQPFVENSILHGLSPKQQGGSIQILCDMTKEYLRIRVLDDGIGITQNKLHEIQMALDHSDNTEEEGGIGIQNVFRRIKLRCGLQYGISINNRPEGGVCVTVLLPVTR